MAIRFEMAVDQVLRREERGFFLWVAGGVWDGVGERGVMRVEEPEECGPGFGGVG